VCARAPRSRCGGDGYGGGCVRAYTYVDSPPPNGIRESAACAPAPL